MIGVATAKALAFSTGKPLYAVNHLHGHVFAAFLESGIEPEYPFVTLLVSGGHSQVVRVDAPTRMRILGRTRDDAAGEAFDKTARLLGLPFPGGPGIDALAAPATPSDPASRVIGPTAARSTCRSPASRPPCNTSWTRPPEKQPAPADVAASFQAAVVDVLIDRLDRAARGGGFRLAVLSGGVAANSALQNAFAAWGRRIGIRTAIPAAALLHR